MWVGCNPGLARGHRFRGFFIAAMAAILVAACSSSREKREETAKGTSPAAGESSGDVMADFEAWANDSKSAKSGGAAASAAASTDAYGGSGDDPGAGSDALDGVIEQFNRKVGTCWKQPFAMPRLATVRLLVRFNPDGTILNVEPRPKAAEVQRYRTEASYMVMIAQTTQALRQCQPYDGIRANFPRLSQLEMTVDPRMFKK